MTYGQTPADEVMEYVRFREEQKQFYKKYFELQGEAQRERLL